MELNVGELESLQFLSPDEVKVIYIRKKSVKEISWICHGLRVREVDLSQGEARAEIEAEELKTSR